MKALMTTREIIPGKPNKPEAAAVTGLIGIVKS